jgi:hypothetical protein
MYWNTDKVTFIFRRELICEVVGKWQYQSCAEEVNEQKLYPAAYDDKFIVLET